MGAGTSARNFDGALDRLLDDAARAVQLLQPEAKRKIMEATEVQDVQVELGAAIGSLPERSQEQLVAFLSEEICHSSQSVGIALAAASEAKLESAAALAQRLLQEYGYTYSYSWLRRQLVQRIVPDCIAQDTGSLHDSSKLEDAQESRLLGISLNWVLNEFTEKVRRRWPKSYKSMSFVDLKVLTTEENGYGWNLVCPRDHKLHCSVVDAVHGYGHSKSADVFLSWVWRYFLETVCTALAAWREENPGDHHVWWCYYQNNQRRLEEESGSSEDLAETFGGRLKDVGKMLMLMDTVRSSAYASRLWCLFEVFIAAEMDIPIQACIAETGRIAFRDMIESGSSELFSYNNLKVNSETAKATMQADEDHIKSKIRRESSFQKVDHVVSLALRRSVRGSVSQAVQASTSHVALCGLELDDDDAAAVAKGLKDNASSQSLALAGNQIGDTGATALADALKCKSSFRTLILSSNQIGDTGAAALAETIEDLGSLKWLFLESNLIGDAGVSALAKVLKDSASILRLLLSDNKITDAGAASLAQALKENASMCQLGLSSTRITDAGAASLAEALKTNTSITHLDLSANRITDAGAGTLAEALKKNTSIRQLEISNNVITDAGAASFVDALGTNNSVDYLDLSGNQITRAGHAALASAFKGDASNLNV